MGVRNLAVLLMLLPLAARAQSAWEEGQWAGDDQYSSQPWDGADAHEDQYAPPDPYETPPPPPDDDSATPQYPPSPPVDQYASPQYQPPSPPVDEYADAGPSMNDFRTGLRSYGRWINTPEYGLVWQPRRVSAQWQPYWDGRWVWTTAGWTWVTDEPWGWATYHYGRWAMVDAVGWVWLPGRVWAPAWVAWRWGGGYAGWCPLGPRGVVYVQPRSWVFVESPRFLAPVRHNTVPINVVTRVWTRAQPLPVMRPTPRAGPPPRIVEEHTRVPVRVVPIVEAQSRTSTRPLASGAVPVWRPRSIPYSRPAAPTTPANRLPQHAERPFVTPGGTVMRGDPHAMPVEQRPAPVYRLPVQPREPERAEQRPQQSPRAEQRPQESSRGEQRTQEPSRGEQRPQQMPRAEQRAPAAQPARPAPPAATPARREHEGPARPAAEPHARPVEAAREREKN
jgi:hypothetical protein